MRTPKKCHELYEILKIRIRDGILPAGTLLPRETELAEEFGVARDTLRAALRELETEGLIRRVRGQGTFVAELDRPLTVTYLLPCADYALSSGISSYRTHNEMIFGLMQDAVKLNCKIEAVPLTADNNPDHINWKLLDSLDSDSRVIVVGSWFRAIFPLLLERRCRVGIILHDAEKPLEKLDGWQVWRMNSEERIRLLADHLRGRGCRRIARTRLPGGPAFAVEGVSDISCGGDVASIRQAVAGAHPDGLILDNAIIRGIDPACGIHRNLGLPEETEVVLADRNCFDETVIRSCVSTFFPYQETARRMLSAIVSGRYVPCCENINPQIQGKSI